MLALDLLLEVLQVAGGGLLTPETKREANSEREGDDDAHEQSLQELGRHLQLIEGREDGEGPDRVAGDLAEEAGGMELGGASRTCDHTLGRLRDHCRDKQNQHCDDDLRQVAKHDIAEEEIHRL